MGKNLPANAGDIRHASSTPWEALLEKEMATHSSTLAWRIPRSEETGGLQSVGQSLTRLSEQTIATHSLHLHLCSCPADGLICTAFLDSTYMQ